MAPANALTIIPRPTEVATRQHLITGDDREYREGFQLPVFDHVPPDCSVVCVHDRKLWPIVQPGEVVVFERGRFYPVPGGLRVVEYEKSDRYSPTVRLHAVQVWPYRMSRDADPMSEEFWGEGPLRPRPGSDLAKRVISWVDGPMPFQYQAERTVGRILGIYRTSPSKEVVI